MLPAQIHRGHFGVDHQSGGEGVRADVSDRIAFQIKNVYTRITVSNRSCQGNSPGVRDIVETKAESCDAAVGKERGNLRGNIVTKSITLQIHHPEFRRHEQILKKFVVVTM